MADSNQVFREDILKAINALQLVVKDLVNEVNLVKFSDSSLTEQVNNLNAVVRDGTSTGESLVIRIVRVEEGHEKLTGEFQLLKSSAEEQLKEVEQTVAKLNSDMGEGKSNILIEKIKGGWGFAAQSLILVGILAGLVFDYVTPNEIDLTDLTPEQIEEIRDVLIP